MPEILREIRVVIVLDLEFGAYIPHPRLLVKGWDAARVVKKFAILISHSFVQGREVLLLGLLPSQLCLLEVSINIFLEFSCPEMISLYVLTYPLAYLPSLPNYNSLITHNSKTYIPHRPSLFHIQPYPSCDASRPSPLTPSPPAVHTHSNRLYLLCFVRICIS